MDEKEKDCKNLDQSWRKEGIRGGIILGCLLGLPMVIFSIVIPSLLPIGPDRKTEPKNSLETKSVTQTYDNNMIELISRETIRDDGYGPIVYIVKDKGTSKEYIIFMQSHTADSMQVFPR